MKAKNCINCGCEFDAKSPHDLCFVCKIKTIKWGRPAVGSDGYYDYGAGKYFNTQREAKEYAKANNGDLMHHTEMFQEARKARKNIEAKRTKQIHDDVEKIFANKELIIGDKVIN